MREIITRVGIKIYSWDELPDLDKELFREAIRIRPNAQAPYSHYKVGCAILAGSRGQVEMFSGVNCEVNSWTQTTHAEQSAISAAIAKMGPARLLRVAVVGAPESKDVPMNPGNERITEVNQVCPSCGHCLQIILENCFDHNGNYDPNVVLMGAHNGEFYRTTIGDALPMPFLPQYLGTNYVKKAGVENS